MSPIDAPKGAGGEPAPFLGSENAFLFTSESVGEGHPDKLCDQISDAILDAHLKGDPEAKVACETCITSGMVMLVGELNSNAAVDHVTVVRETLRGVGYTHSSTGFDATTCNVILAIEQQSPDIAQGVYEQRQKEEIGAGDQGLMFGYASDETEECMPLTILLAHQLNQKLARLRYSGFLPWLRPDSKAQVTCEYDYVKGFLTPFRVHTVVISAQHEEGQDLESMRSQLLEHVVKTVIPAKYLDGNTIYHMQPSGRFVIGGPKRSCGFTGKKIIADTYGGWGSHGGGAFSGKDYTKVDRSAAYAARWVALSLVKSGLARRALVQLSYAIGVADPLNITVLSYGTGKVPEEDLLKVVKHNFDLRPGMIVQDLDMKSPIYRETSCYGHFGRKNFAWEKPKALDLSCIGL